LALFPRQPGQRLAILVRVAPAERPAVPILSRLVCPVMAPIRFRPEASRAAEILPEWAFLATAPIRFRLAASRAAAIPVRRAAFQATGPILAAWAVFPVMAPIRFRSAVFPVAPAVSVIRSAPVALAPAARA
jgi:hypothetical protein